MTEKDALLSEIRTLRLTQDNLFEQLRSLTKRCDELETELNNQRIRTTLHNTEIVALSDEFSEAIDQAARDVGQLSENMVDRFNNVYEMLFPVFDRIFPGVRATQDEIKSIIGDDPRPSI